MKPLPLICLIVGLLFCARDLRSQETELRVMSFNIRCGSCEQPADINHWSRRKTLVIDLIRTQQPDLLALQEAELFQVRDLASELAQYAWFGVGRDDGKEKGETTAILFDKARFSLASQQTFWLSETPEVPGKGWDAALSRTVSIAVLNDRFSARQLVLLNAHFDHHGQQAKLESSKLIVRLANLIAGDLPIILTGDFNYTPSFAGYHYIASTLRDTERISLSSPQGGNVSFNGFGKHIISGNKIDYIFVSGHFRALSHSLIVSQHEGRYPSDHYPVVARLQYQ